MQIRKKSVYVINQSGPMLFGSADEARDWVECPSAPQNKSNIYHVGTAAFGAFYV